MPFQKGQSGNPNGRPKKKGTRDVEALRKTLQALIENNIETLQEDFIQLSVKDRLDFILKALRFVMPAPLHPIEKLSPEDIKTILHDLSTNN